MAKASKEQQDIGVSDPFPYARVYSDSSGETHFADEEIGFELVDYAPPAPPISVSEAIGAERVTFISSPPGWIGDFHPAPRRQFIFVLAGELEVEVSDGNARRFGPGSVCLVEDTEGKGHISRVTSDERGFAVAVPLVHK
jgi:quercetin dioxygenase-like cupin family protein